MGDWSRSQKFLAALACYLTFILVVIADVRAYPPAPPPVRAAICSAFGARCQAALNVAACETGGTWDVRARNGQYLGLFQVSAHWRRTVPGFAMNARAQARHAYRVFVLTGRSWAHWECQP